MGALPVQRCFARTPYPLIVLALALAPLSSSPAAAAIPAAQEVTAKARVVLSRAAPARLTYVETRSAGPPALAMRLVVVPGDGLRMEHVALSDAAKVGPEARVWRRGEALPMGVSALHRAPAWLQLLAGEDLRAVLKRMDADRERVSLAHADGTILWVVGAGPRALDQPQLHVVRATGRVWRIIERQAVGDGVTTLDVTWQGEAPTTPEDATWWPSVLIVKDAQGVRRFELRAIERDLEGAPETLLEPETSPGEGSGE